MRKRRRSSERGFVMIAVMVGLVLVSALGLMLSNESALEADLTNRETEALQAQYLAQAALQHALWQTDSSACSADFGVPDTPLGDHSYAATVSGGGSTTTHNLVVDQDAWIRSDQPTTNNGSSGTLHIKDSQVEQPLIRFDLSSLPAGAQINSASASFFVLTSGMGGGGHPEGPVTVHRVTADWTEAGATWDNMAGNYDKALLATIPAEIQGDVRVEINLTAQVQAWVNGQPNHGILLYSSAPGIHAQYVSKEGAASEQPRLEVVVGTAPASPVRITATGTLDSGVKRTLGRPAVSAYQPTSAAVMQLGVDPGEDAMPDSFYGTRNYGGANFMQVHDNGTDWQQYPLIRFDLARLPSGVSVRSARLELSLQSVNAPGTASIHRVTRGWVEGTQSGGGQADGATWYTHDGTNAWTSEGGDYDTSAVAETVINGGETWVSWEIGPLVEDWLAGEPNYGLMIRPDSALKQAKFASREDSDPTVAPKLTIEYACECGAVCLTPQGTGNVLMVVINPTTLVPADASKKALFESWGYTVDVLSESANQSSYDDAVAISDVAFISETVNAMGVGSKLEGAAIGVVSQDGAYNGELGFATGSSWAVSPELTVTDSSHYITQVFAGGPLDIYSGAMEQLTVSGVEAAGLTTLAETGGGGSLVALDQGAMMSTGVTAAGRRVMLPFGRESNLSWQHLNGNGLVMLQRSLTWASGLDAAPSGPNVLLVVVNPGSLDAQESAKKALIESWGYTVNVIDESDSQASFDTALSANDVAYVSNSVSATAIGTKLTATTVGIVSEERALIVELGFGVDTGSELGDEIDILDNTHPITTGFALGMMTIVTSQQPLMLVNNGTATGVDALAQILQVGSFYEPSLMTLETGAQVVGGGSASGRRVSLPWGDPGFDINSLNDDGRTVMQRAIEWAADLAAGPTGPTAHWKLDETIGWTATDSEGGHDGVLANGPAWVPGQVDGGLEFDGVDDAIIVPHNDTLSLTQAMTFSAWVRSDAFGVSGPYDLVVSKGTVATSYAYYFGALNDEIIFGFSAEGAYREFTTPSLNLATGTWHHIAATFDNSTDEVRLYHDGVEVLAATTTYEPSATTHNIYIGSSEDGADWDGVLDDVRIYDRALTGQEVAALATEVDTGGGGGGATDILLVVGNASSPTEADTGRWKMITDWGYTVTLFDDSESQSAFDVAVTANDVVFVTGSVGGGTLADKLTGANIAIVNEFPGKLDNFGFSSGTTQGYNSSGFSSTNASHYITSPFGGRSVTAFSSFAYMYMPVPSGTLAPGLQNLGSPNGAPMDLDVQPPGLSVLDTGATRWDGGAAPARRVHLPFSSVPLASMSADGLTIMRRAIEWAGEGAGDGGGSQGVVFEEFTEGRQQIGVSSGFRIPKPSGTTAGDLLIVAAATDGNTVSTLTPYASWNLTALDVGDSTGDVTFGVWWKVADGTESSELLMQWTGGEQGYGWIMRFTGHDPNTPIGDFLTTTGNSTTPYSPPVTTKTENELILRLSGFDDDDIVLDETGLPAEHTVITMDRSNTGNRNTVSGGAGYFIQPTAGDSGGEHFRLSAREQYRSTTLAIRPAP